MVDLRTQYLGLALSHPIVASASPLSKDQDGVKRLEDIGVTECIVGFRDTYKGEPDDKSIEHKIAILRWFADNIIAKTGDPV